MPSGLQVSLPAVYSKLDAVPGKICSIVSVSQFCCSGLETRSSILIERGSDNKIVPFNYNLPDILALQNALASYGANLALLADACVVRSAEFQTLLMAHKAGEALALLKRVGVKGIDSLAHTQHRRSCRTSTTGAAAQ